MAQKKYVSLEKLDLYNEKIKKVITDADAVALQAAKDYTDESFELAGGNAASLANTAEANAKTYTDGKITEVNSTIAGVKTIAEQGVANAATADGKAVAAQAAADAAQTDVDALETYVGAIPEGYTEETVVAYINKKSEETLAAAQGGSSETAASVKQQLDNYKSENNTRVGEIEGDVSALQTALDEEIARADAAEKANAAAIKAISDDYLTSDDKEELQGNIDTVSGAVERLTNGVSAEEIDGVNDLIAYVNEHGTEVTGMKDDIAGNTAAIEGVAGRVTTLEGEMDGVQAAVATKVEQTAYDTKVAELADADTALSGRIAALEGAVGESGSVAEDIAAAKTYADGLNTSMNTRVEALEAVDHEHGNKALLDTYTQTEANLADAVAKKHEHSNLAVLEGITAAKITEWDKVSGKAEQTALQSEITRATDAEVALGARIDEFVECSEEDINGLFA